MSVNLNEKTNKYYFKCYYTDYEGNRRQKKQEGFKLQREAKAAEAEFLARYTSDCTMTFETLVSYFFNDRKTHSKATTLHAQAHDFNRHFLPIFGKLPLNQITPAMVRKWQNNAAKADYARSTINRLHASLSAVFNFAVKYYGLKANPARLAGNISKAKNKRVDFWTLEEFNTAINTLTTDKGFLTDSRRTTDAQTLVAAYTILFYSGLRVGELLALTLADFDATSNTLHISKTLATVNGKQVIQPPKTEKSNRSVVLPQKVSTLVSVHINRLYKPNQSERLFPALTNQTLLLNLRRLAKVAGIKKIRLHDLRHSHASLLINLNCSPLLISERLGHENVQTTLNIYSHLYPNKAQEMAAQLNNLIK